MRRRPRRPSNRDEALWREVPSNRCRYGAAQIAKLSKLVMLVASVYLLRSPMWGTASCPHHLLVFYAWRGCEGRNLPEPLAPNWSEPLPIFPARRMPFPRGPVVTQGRRSFSLEYWIGVLLWCQTWQLHNLLRQLISFTPINRTTKVSRFWRRTFVVLVLDARIKGCHSRDQCCMADTSIGRSPQFQNAGAPKLGSSWSYAASASTVF